MKPAAPKGGTPNAAILQAVKKGDVSSIKKVIDKPDSGLDGKAEKGRNMLQVACAEGQLDVVKLLLSKKASAFPLDVADDDGNTAVHLACEGGWSKIVELLLKQNPPPKLDLTNKKGNTILHAMFIKQKWRSDEVKVLKQLLNEKKPLLSKDLINTTNGDQLTALQLGCMRGHYDGCVFLLNAKADATIVKAGDPPLFSATYAENPSLIKALLQHGADIGQSNAKHQSLLEIVNPKSEIYRIIKNHMLSTPGGERKMKMASEDVIVATKIAQIPPDLQRLITASGIAQDLIEKNWDTFCTCAHFVAKKRIFASEADAEKYKETKKNTSAPVSDQTKALSAKLVKPGDPQKLYKKLHVAGRGGFGMVFAGTGPDKKEVAIKRMPHSSEKDKRQNLTEANFLANAKHPNICQYITTYECEAQHELWVIMELLDGGNLDEGVDIESDSRFEERHIAYAAREILQALDYLHGQKPPIAHRDLKAGNVMMTVDGDVKLIDFGLALEVPEGGKIELCGSPFWLPPEMILRQPHNTSADIWSMAVCLLELANKKAPNSDSALRSMFLVATGTHPWLEKPEKWSAEMHGFLKECLQHAPAKRGTAPALLKHEFLKKACNKSEMATLLRSLFVSSSVNMSKITM